jgi:hypothetical protein
MPASETSAEAIALSCLRASGPLYCLSTTKELDEMIHLLGLDGDHQRNKHFLSLPH